MDQGIISDSLPTQNPTDPWDERSIYYKCLIFYGQLVGKYYTYDIVPWIRHGKYNPPPPKNAVLKLFQRTITYPTKQERRKIIDCKSAGDWMGYAILPTLRIPKDPWNGLNLYGVRGPQAKK